MEQKEIFVIIVIAIVVFGFKGVFYIKHEGMYETGSMVVINTGPNWCVLWYIYGFRID